MRDNLLNWAVNLKLEHVILTDDKNDIESIGGKEWKKRTLVIKRAFIGANGIKIPHKLRTSKDVGEIVAQQICAKSQRDIMVPQKKKKSASTKPKCLTRDGTLYRVINTISECKDSFIETKNAHDKDDLDSRMAKAVPWQTMTSHYNSDRDTLKSLSPMGQEVMVGQSIPSDIAH